MKLFDMFSSKTETQKLAHQALKKTGRGDDYKKKKALSDEYLGTIEKKGDDFEKIIAGSARRATSKSETSTFAHVGQRVAFEMLYDSSGEPLGAGMGQILAKLSKDTGRTILGVSRGWGPVQDAADIGEGYLEEIIKHSKNPVEKKLADYGLEASNLLLQEIDEYRAEDGVTEVIANGVKDTVSDSLIESGFKVVDTVEHWDEGKRLGMFFLEKIAKETDNSTERTLAEAAAKAVNGEGKDWVYPETGLGVTKIALKMLKDGVKEKSPGETLREFVNRATKIGFDGSLTKENAEIVRRRVKL